MWLKKLFFYSFLVNFWHISGQLLVSDLLNVVNQIDEPSYPSSSRDSRSKSVDPEATMTVEEVIQYHGYPVEIYDVETCDGYIITIQRIPYGKYGGVEESGFPVLLQHGLFCNSAIWIMNPPDKSLPYLLADEGYDVWLGNVRGTIFGKKHVEYSPSDAKFWEFSFDEMAAYDIPAIIDMILIKTGFAHIYYIGYSMGTSIVFALLSDQPEYNNIIKAVFALAPVTSVQHARGLAKLLKPLFAQFHFIMYTHTKPLVLLEKMMLNLFRYSMCSGKDGVCLNMVYAICGIDKSQYNKTRSAVYFHHFPDIASMRNLVHYTQLSQTSKFQHLDHGPIENVERYGQSTPPVYDLARITTPVALFWGENDYLADPRDVNVLAKELNNLILSYKVPYEQFSHMDFVWAKDVVTLLYDKLLAEMYKNLVKF